MRAAQETGCWKSVQEMQEGDVLIFDFPGNAARTDHTGICYGVVKAGGRATGAVTIEGNTGTVNDANGGMVMQRTRAASVILGAVRPDWAKVAALSPEARPTLALVAQRVLNGEFGNGDMRRARLAVAGYDPAAVQRIVNALVSGAYQVRVTASNLNVRAQPGTDAAVLDKLTKGAVVPVSEVRDGKDSASGWGRVGTGWIALDHVTAV